MKIWNEAGLIFVFCLKELYTYWKLNCKIYIHDYVIWVTWVLGNAIHSESLSFNPGFLYTIHLPFCSYPYRFILTQNLISLLYGLKSRSDFTTKRILKSTTILSTIFNVVFGNVSEVGSFIAYFSWFLKVVTWLMVHTVRI